jgi:hypothetical protein
VIWILFFAAAAITAAVLVPVKHWKGLLPAGITGLAAVYIIDSIFVWLGAFGYSADLLLPPGLPLFYWLSSFFGGIILFYHCPEVRNKRTVYILIAAGIFLIIELIMNLLGYFHYAKWNPAYSYILNIMGFAATLWVSEQLGSLTAADYQ